MVNQNRIDTVWSLYNAVRGVTTSDKAVEAIAVLKKLSEIYEGQLQAQDREKVYNTMRDIVDGWGIMNPFQDEEKFSTLCAAFDPEITWEDILNLYDPQKMFRAPKALIDDMARQFSKSTKTVLIAEAEKYTPYLVDLIQGHEECQYTITSMNIFSYHILKEMFEEYENVEVLLTSIYEYEFSSQKFDLILCVPVFGGRDMAEDDNQFICREYDLVAFENLLLHLNADGKLSILLPARITFAAGRVRELRNFIQSMYKLLEIDELPVGLFMNTGIKTFLFTVATGRTEDVIIKRLKTDTVNPRKEGVNELITEDETFVFGDELAEMDDWNVDRIFASQDEDWLKFENSLIRKEELGNVAEVFRGKAISKKAPMGKIGVVNISNLQDYGIDYDHLDHIDEEERKVANYILQNGDVLLPARGTAIRVSIFKDQGYPCIAHSNVIVIRPNKELLSGTYLKLFLDSPLGNKILTAKQQGTVVINISYKDLKSMEVPVPPMDEQVSIAKEYNEELSRYLETISAAEERWNSVLAKLQEKI